MAVSRLESSLDSSKMMLTPPASLKSVGKRFENVQERAEGNSSVAYLKTLALA